MWDWYKYVRRYLAMLNYLTCPLQEMPYNTDDDIIKATSFEVISTLREVLRTSSLWKDHVQTYTQVWLTSLTFFFFIHVCFFYHIFEGGYSLASQNFSNLWCGWYIYCWYVVCNHPIWAFLLPIPVSSANVIEIVSGGFVRVAIEIPDHKSNILLDALIICNFLFLGCHWFTH